MIKYIEHQKLSELKRDNGSWEKWCNCQILQRHFCHDEINLECLTIDDAAIFYASSEGSAPFWYYAHVWLADEKEVYDGEAEEIGEVISSHCFAINFCPMCGENLEKLVPA